MRVVDAVRQIDGLEWRAVAGEELGPIVAEVDRVSGLPTDANASGMDEPDQLLSEFDDYVDVVHEMLSALRRGDTNQARDIDESRVDPQFERVVELATSIADRRQAVAFSTERTVGLLTWLITMSAVAVCAGLLLTVGRARAGPSHGGGPPVPFAGREFA